MEVKKIAAILLAVYLFLLGLGATQHLLIDHTGLLQRPIQAWCFLFYQPKVWLLSIVVFFTAFWILAFRRLLDMAAYIATRKASMAIACSLLYITPNLLLLLSRTYHPWIHLPLVIFIIGFPYLFSHQDIQNPIQATKHSVKLLGKAGQSLPLNAPELGVFIIGSPGCGKTKYVVEPILYRLIQQGYAGLLYDYDFSAQAQGKNYSLTHLVYHCCKHFCKGKVQFLSINFQDLTTSSRINPISPTCIQDRKKLSHILYILLLNMNPHMGQKEDFWYKNTYALLKSLVICFANNYPQYCTLPHIIMAGLQPLKQLMPMLEQDREAKLYASPILDAFHHAPEQLAGVMANFKLSLERLLDPHLFWVLSSDDTPHVINDPARPLLVCLGNTPTEKKGLSPVLAMIMAFLSTNMYAHERNKSFLMLDELPTLLLPDLAEVPATARKYGIATVVALQNIAQLEKHYGPVGATELQETFSNHFIGRSQFRLSKELSERIGKKETHTSSHTISTHQESETIHEKEKDILTPQETMSLAVGEFVGHVAASDQGFFRMKLKPIGDYDKHLDYQKYSPLPKTTQAIDAQKHFLEIQQTVAALVNLSESAIS